MKETKVKILRSSSGITLVALVVTIVILIILATISVNVVFGEDGLIKQAKQGRQDYLNEQKTEQDQLEQLAQEYKDIAEEEIDIPDTDSKYFSFTFNSEQKEATITGIKDEYKFNGAIKDGDNIITEIGIPKTVKDENNVEYSVTVIGIYAFYECTSLTKVSIPNSVTTVKEGAFYECTSLTRVSIPNSVTVIGMYTFFSCTSLTKVSIPDNVTVIGGSAFYECTSLTRVSIPNSVTIIGDYAFSMCTSLTRVEIPNSVTAIGKDTFSECSNLTKINIKKPEGTIAGDPWGAPNGTGIITWETV